MADERAERELPQVCVVYLVRPSRQGDEVLLGRKKTGLGLGKLVGPGGKLEKYETPRQAAVREVREEVGVIVDSDDLVPIGELTYSFPAHPRMESEVVGIRLSQVDGPARRIRRTCT